MQPDETHISPAGFGGGQGRTPDDAEAQAACAALVGILIFCALAVLAAAFAVAAWRGLQ